MPFNDDMSEARRIEEADEATRAGGKEDAEYRESQDGPLDAAMEELMEERLPGKPGDGPGLVGEDDGAVGAKTPAQLS